MQFLRRSALHVFHALHALYPLTRRFGGWGAFCEPDGFADQQAQALGRWRHLARVFVGVHAFGELDAQAFQAGRCQALHHLGRAALSRLIAVEGDQHPAHAAAPEGGKVVFGEAFHTIGRRHVGVARAPEGHGVDQGFGEDDFFLALQALGVPHAPVRAGQVQVRRTFHLVADLAAVDFGDVARVIKHRHHQAAVEVFVAALAQHAQALQAGAQLAPGLHPRLRQAQAQGAVGKAQAEFNDQFAGMLAIDQTTQTPFVQVGQRLGTGQQGLVVVVHDLVQQLLFAGLQRHRNGQTAHGGALDAHSTRRAIQASSG